jgi:2-succinyl-6-hydroxy-2,4-cyclohexadiene-1-carboxylate synthase
LGGVRSIDVTNELATSSSGSGPRVALLHGFAQTSMCWGPLHSAIATDHEVVTIDAPGHGRSAGVSADLWGAADLVVDAGGVGTYVGYSLGGRICLHAALAHPEAVARLVLIGATAGIDHPTGRRQRVRSDEALARRIEHDGVEAFVKEWLANPLFAGLPPEYRFEDERRENTEQGLADSLRRCGTGTQKPLWNRLSTLEMPVLAVAGHDDTKNTSLAIRLADQIGDNASVLLVDGAGHSPHLEQPDEVVGEVRAWLVETAP